MLNPRRSALSFCWLFVFGCGRVVYDLDAGRSGESTGSSATGGMAASSVASSGTGGAGCGDSQCTGPPSVCYEEKGVCANGTCSYAFADGVSCDDGDACTTGDSCASGGCEGTPIVCTTPPAPACVSATTQRTYDAAGGTCAAGVCTYSFVDTECAAGCSAGMCKMIPLSISASDSDESNHRGSTCVVLGSGAVKCWGHNSRGQLGNSSTTDSLSPVDVTGLSSGVVAVTARGGHTCALTSAGAVKCWGYNINGELGNGSGVDSTVPVDVVGLSSGVVAISAGNFHTCALTFAGAVKCWGDNLNGQLGNNSTTLSSVPVDVANLSSGILSVSAGAYYTCAVTSVGGAFCWGRGQLGELGNDSTTDSPIPVPVTGLSSGVVAVSASDAATCALTSAGAVKCWGTNTSGELGNDSTLDSPAPVPVMGLSSGIAAISSGGHTCALNLAGGLQCWGANLGGELGDNSMTTSLLPVDVSGLSSGVVAVSTGTAHTCAITSAGGVKCWGSNDGGQLGNNSTTSSSVPVDVVGL